MITKEDLLSAIAECQGKRSPDASTCIKLAAFYTLKEHLFPEHTEEPIVQAASYSAPPSSIVSYSGDSEFAEAIHGRRAEDVWPVMDELMQTIETIHPRLYNGVMRKLME